MTPASNGGSGPASAPPGLKDIERIAARAFAGIPDALRRHAENVTLHVQDFPDSEIEKDMGLESPFDLLGLYQGVSLAEKSIADAPADQDRVFLYRRPILDYWAETGEPLEHIVRHVLIHEIGHHFGLSDADMEAIENAD
ncbi:MAG: metallopeptidase family protein [Rhodospirillales bacterium]